MSDNQFEVITPMYHDKESETQYNGKTFGVQFADGRAILNDATVPEKLGRSVEHVAHKMKTDFGYEVIDRSHKSSFAVPDLPWHKSDEGPDKIGATFKNWLSFPDAGKMVFHDDHGPVEIVRLNKKSVRLQTENGDIFTERDLEIITDIKTAKEVLEAQD